MSLIDPCIGCPHSKTRADWIIPESMLARDELWDKMEARIRHHATTGDCHEEHRLFPKCGTGSNKDIELCEKCVDEALLAKIKALKEGE